MSEAASDHNEGQGIRDIATRWSLVKRYRDGNARVSEIAADEIARIYLVPLFAWLRGKGLSREDAQDTLQEFMARMFGKEMLKLARPENGRLRGFLLTSLRNFMNGRHRARNAQRRGGGAVHFPVDWLTVEDISRCAAGEDSPEAAYDRAWAGVFMETALARVESYYRDSGRIEVFRHLLPVIEDEMAPGRYAEISAELGVSAAALRVTAFRLKERFAIELRAAAGRAFDLPEGPELDGELRAVFGR
jgi:DNA-directed RNA polymerase specialized sigma24 family protein